MLNTSSQTADQDRLSWPIASSAIGLIVAATCSFATLPQDGKPMAAIFPPWHSDQKVFAGVIAAGGRPLEFGGVAGIVIALGDDPGFAPRLRQFGALLIVDAAVARVLCLTK